jgi:RecA/RadA recombinase
VLPDGVRSITANLRVDFCGRGELADRQQKLGQLMSALKKIAEQFNVAVVITNQVSAHHGAKSVLEQLMLASLRTIKRCVVTIHQSPVPTGNLSDPDCNALGHGIC